MKYTESILQNWTKPLSDTEEQRVENTVNMVRTALSTNETLKTMDFDVFAQGSYANNTNVRSDSDVDVCVMLKNPFHIKIPDNKTASDYGFIIIPYSFPEFRQLVKNAIVNKFGRGSIKDGNKSIKIRENTYHVNADIVPAFQLRNYKYLNSSNPDVYKEGIWFQANDGNEVENYPRIHISNGNEKNSKTNHYYKKLVRIMKHIKNNMVDDKATDGDKISSFLVESMVWNIPVDYFTYYNTWEETIRLAIRFLYNGFEQKQYTKWREVSGMLYLFSDDRKWTAVDARQWLLDAWFYLGFNGD